MKQTKLQSINQSYLILIFFFLYLFGERMIEFLGEFASRLGGFVTGASSDAIRVISGQKSNSVLIGIDNDDLCSFLRIRPDDSCSVSAIAHQVAVSGATPTLRSTFSEIFSDSARVSGSSSSSSDYALPVALHRKGGCRCRACRAVQSQRQPLFAMDSAGQYPQLPPDSPFRRRNAGTASIQAAPPPPAPPPPPPPPPPTLYRKDFANPLSLAAMRKRKRLEGGGDGDAVVVTPIKGKNKQLDAPNCAMPLAEIMGGLKRLRKTGRLTPHGGMVKEARPKPKTPKNLIESAILLKFRVCSFSSTQIMDNHS